MRETGFGYPISRGNFDPCLGLPAGLAVDIGAVAPVASLVIERNVLVVVTACPGP